MKCIIHPDKDAVGVCVSCGSGVCSECEVKVAGKTYCKMCVEAGRVQPEKGYAPEAVPSPTGKPSKSFFVIGAIGLLILMIGATLNWASYFAFWYYYYYYFVITNLYETISYVLIGVGCTLGGLGFLGYRRNYGSSMGLSIFVISLIFSWWLLAANLLLYTGLVYTYYYYYYYYYILLPGPLYFVYFVLYLVGSELFGVLMILWGAAMINIRNYTGKGGLGVATGILLIIAGSFTCSLFLGLIGLIMLLPSGIIGMIYFFTSQVEFV